MKTTAVRRILVPVDLSSCSRAALEFAYSLGAALGASLEVLFVYQPNDGTAFGAKEANATRQELHRFIETAELDASVPATERVESGDPRDRIVKIAESDGFDLIVLGTHGRSGRPRMLAGSVAESVVRTASRPVLTVREAP
jgi:nucleotide-binding universal stress UspA family protein